MLKDMNKILIGQYIQQKEGFKAFVPSDFPPKKALALGGKLVARHTEAVQLLGKLDGITELLPDKDWFLKCSSVRMLRHRAKLRARMPP